MWASRNCGFHRPSESRCTPFNSMLWIDQCRIGIKSVLSFIFVFCNRGTVSVNYDIFLVWTQFRKQHNVTWCCIYSTAITEKIKTYIRLKIHKKHPMGSFITRPQITTEMAKQKVGKWHGFRFYNILATGTKQLYDSTEITFMGGNLNSLRLWNTSTSTNPLTTMVIW